MRHTTVHFLQGDGDIGGIGVKNAVKEAHKYPLASHGIVRPWTYAYHQLH
jgi:hypothetical protein